MADLLGLSPLTEPVVLLKFALRFGLNIAFATVVIRLVYFRRHRDHDYVFTYYLLNAITFSLCFLLRKVPAELGFALAIFAVFGVLRYRTEQIRIRELTYLFVVIGIAIINAVANKKISGAELLIINSVIVILVIWLEYTPRSTQESSLVMFYDNLELLAPDCRARLIQDLSRKTGLKVIRVEIERVDLLRDAARLNVYYLGDGNTRSSAPSEVKPREGEITR